MNIYEAHKILDLVRAGVFVALRQINAALAVTGDLVRHPFNMRAK